MIAAVEEEASVRRKHRKRAEAQSAREKQAHTLLVTGAGLDNPKRCQERNTNATFFELDALLTILPL